MFEAPVAFGGRVAAPEKKPTAKEVAAGLVVGIVLHDNVNAVGAGWAFLPDRADPIRIRGLFDLPNDAIWISSADYEQFRRSGMMIPHHVRRASYLGLKLKEIAADFGLRLDGNHMVAGGQRLVPYIQHVVRTAVEVYGMDDALRDLQEETLVATIGKKLPASEPSKEMLLQRLSAAYQSWSSIHVPFMDNTVRVRLRFNRMPYAEWLLDHPVPDSGWSLIPSEIGFNHDAVMAGEFPPTLIEAVVEFDHVPTEVAELIAYGVGASKQRAKRNWMTDVEYRWISQFARVHVKSYLMSVAKLPLQAGSKLPQALVQSREVRALPSAGIVSYLHWQALVASKYSRLTNANEYDATATWVRAHDRAKCFEAALALRQCGFNVSGYGNGSVSVQVDKARLLDLEQVALALDFTMPRWNALKQEFGYVSPDIEY